MCDGVNVADRGWILSIKRGMVKTITGPKGDPVDSGAESIFSSKQTVDTSKQSYEPQHGPEIKDNYHARTVDIWALGITIVIGGQYFNWNKGLTAGFGSYAIATFLIGTAYICLCLCTSELSSALPFAGKRYYDDLRVMLVFLML